MVGRNIYIISSYSSLLAMRARSLCESDASPGVGFAEALLSPCPEGLKPGG